MATPEARVKDGIKKELDSRGFWRAGTARPKGRVIGWYYMPVSNGMGVHGIPDFVGIHAERPFYIEAKAPKGEPTANQLLRHEEIREAGGTVLIIDDVQKLRDYFDKP